jgi:hypothetical protein
MGSYTIDKKVVGVFVRFYCKHFQQLKNEYCNKSLDFGMRHRVEFKE